MSAIEANLDSLRLVNAPPNGCHKCSNADPQAQYISLGEPAFVLNAGLELSMHMPATVGENPDGTTTVTYHDQVAGAWREQQHIVQRELVLCANCIGSALTLIGFGDVTEAEADRDRAREQAAELRGQLADRDSTIAELEDALAAGRTARTELEATIASLTRRNGQPSEPATPEPEPAKPPRRRKKATA